MAAQLPSRHRPSPLVATQQTETGAGRSHLLSSLRSARPTPTPQMPPFATPQDYQTAMLSLQQQILLQQSQLLLASQQQEAQQAILAMRRGSGGMMTPNQQMMDQANLAAAFQKQQQQAYLQQQAQAYQQLPQSAFLTSSFVTPTQNAFVSPEEEASVMRNPLAASALARRKRQSLNMEAAAPLVATGIANGNGNANANHARRVSLNGVPSFVRPGHHRRASSSASSFSASNFSSSTLSNRSSPTSTEPPALILSKPGEAFPISTSGSEAGSDRSARGGSPPLGRTASPETGRNGRTREPSAADMSTQWRPTHSHSSSRSSGSNASASAPASDEKEAAAVQAPIPVRTDSNDSATSDEPAIRLPERRASQASTLTAALSGRRQRPASIGAPPQLTPLEPQQFQQRAVSDPFNLSPFATTFQPLPPSPYTPSPLDLNMIYGFPQPQFQGQGPYQQYQQQPAQPAYQRPVNPSPAGTASAIRQPKGPAPESDFKQANFAAMVRRSAIATILRAGSVSAGVGDGAAKLARLSLVEV